LVVRDWNRALKKAQITLTNSAAYVLRLFAKESCLLEISGMYVHGESEIHRIRIVETELISVMTKLLFFLTMSGNVFRFAELDDAEGIANRA